MLKPTLLANAASCALFGLAFIFLGSATSVFLGNPPKILLSILGFALLAYSVLLVAAAWYPATPRIAIQMFVFGDAMWVLATAILILSGIWITTAPGIMAAVAVAAFVGACGWSQWRCVQSRQT